MILRPEQESIISECLAAVEFGSKNIVLDLHTSFGKSLIMSELAKKLEGRIVIMVNITPLIDQIAEHLDELGMKYSILKAGYEDRFNSEERIQLVMSQTFYARMDKVTVHADYFIQDEVHREYDTERTTSLLNHLQPTARIGLTGTPIDSLGYALQGSEIITGSSIKNSEEKDYIVPLKYYVPEWSTKISYDTAAMSGADYSSISLNEILNEPKHVNMVVASMNALNAKDKKTLVFCNSIEHCEVMTTALQADGYDAEMVHSKQDGKMNDLIMESFSSNQPINDAQDDLFCSNDDSIAKTVKCLLSVSKLNIGFSVKDIELGVMLRPTLVRSLWIQSCGRLIREDGKKEYAEMLDLAQCTQEHGFHSTPYNAPVKGDKKGLLKEKEKVACPEIALLCNEEPTLITMENIELKMKELKTARENIESESDINRLSYLFDIAETPFDIIRIAGVIGNKHKHLPPMSEKNILFISDEWDLMIEANMVHKNRILKTLKTMAKNKIRDSKKLVALKYSVEWLYGINDNFVNHNEVEFSGIEDDDIPF